MLRISILWYCILLASSNYAASVSLKGSREVTGFAGKLISGGSAGSAARQAAFQATTTSFADTVTPRSTASTSSSSTSSETSPAFRRTLLSKSKQQIEADKSKIPFESFFTSGFTSTASSTASPFSISAEALPDSAESINYRSSGSSRSYSSAEEFSNMLGVETTSATPTFFSESHNIQSGQLRQASSSRFRPSQEEIDDIEIITQQKERAPAQRIKAAVHTKHTFEYRPVPVEISEEMEPRIIEVAARNAPLEIHFKSASSRIKVVQTHKADELGQIQRTSSSDEPQRLMHLVRKPIIQEVREIITPYRRIVQEIAPVMEEIHTVVAHEGQRTHAKQSKTNLREKPHLPTVSAVVSSSSSSSTTANAPKPEPIPKDWLRPVPKSSPSSSSDQAVIVEQQRIPAYSGGKSNPKFGTFPLFNQGSSSSSSSSEHPDEIDSEVEERSSNEISSANDRILPARLITKEVTYQARQPLQQQQQQQQQRSQLRSTNVAHQSGPYSYQNLRASNSFARSTRSHPSLQSIRSKQQQQQQLRESASSPNWQAIRPYVYYGAMNGQVSGPFQYQSRQNVSPAQHPQHHQNYHHSSSNNNNNNFINNNQHHPNHNYNNQNNNNNNNVRY